MYYYLVWYFGWGSSIFSNTRLDVTNAFQQIVSSFMIPLQLISRRLNLLCVIIRGLSLLDCISILLPVPDWLLIGKLIRVVNLTLNVLLLITFFLGNNLISWSYKHQHSKSHFSAEVEYECVANVVAEVTWLHNLPFLAM